MNKKEAKSEFIELYLDKIPFNDKPMLAEQWGIYIDSLCKSGKITHDQYSTWTHPVFSARDFLTAKEK